MAAPTPGTTRSRGTIAAPRCLEAHGSMTKAGRRRLDRACACPPKHCRHRSGPTFVVGTAPGNAFPDIGSLVGCGADTSCRAWYPTGVYPDAARAFLAFSRAVGLRYPRAHAARGLAARESPKLCCSSASAAWGPALGGPGARNPQGEHAGRAWGSNAGATGSDSIHHRPQRGQERRALVVDAAAGGE